MAFRDLLDDIFGGDFYSGICDECRHAQFFRTERDRDLWQKHHTHNPENNE